MRIRRAAESESAELSDLARAVRQHRVYSPAQMADWRPGLMTTADFLSVNHAFVAELDGQAVGFYALVPLTIDTGCRPIHRCE